MGHQLRRLQALPAKRMKVGGCLASSEIVGPGSTSEICSMFSFFSCYILCKNRCIGMYLELVYDICTYVYYESWVVPAGVPSALADILGADRGPIIDFVIERGGGFGEKINLLWGGGGPGVIRRRHPQHHQHHHQHHHHHRQKKVILIILISIIRWVWCLVRTPCLKDVL